MKRGRNITPLPLHSNAISTLEMLPSLAFLYFCGIILVSIAFTLPCGWLYESSIQPIKTDSLISRCLLVFSWLFT